MNITALPLNCLDPSPHNVRKTGGLSVKDLAANIAAVGLLHNIVVRTGTGGRFEVVDGSRRVAALRQLVDEKALPSDYKAPCAVLASNTDAGATEASLSANTMREAMHPADACEAFQRLITEGRTLGDIASHFGVTEAFVKQRLRLAGLSPKLIAIYRDGKATLEQMMALAIVEDHDAQEKAWEAGERSDWQRRPDQLRGALVQKEVALDSTLGKFVGLADYEKAGGAVRRDLFSEFATLPDTALVNRLALAKLDAAAGKLRSKGWGWVETRLELDYTERNKYRQVGGTPDAKLGAIVYLDGHMGLQKLLGLVKPGQKAPTDTGDKAKAQKSTTSTGKGSTRETTNFIIGLRTGLIRKRLRSNPLEMLAALAATMAVAVFYKTRWKEPVAGVITAAIDNGYCDIGDAGSNTTDPQGVAELAALEKRLTLGAKSSGSMFRWLMKQGGDEVESILVTLATASVESSEEYGMSGDAKAFAAELGLDLAAGWQPTPAWLEKQPKAWILEAVVDACGQGTDKPLAKLTTKELAAKAHALLQTAKWVPEQLRSSKPKPPAVKKAAKAAAKGKKPAKAKK